MADKQVRSGHWKCVLEADIIGQGSRSFVICEARLDDNLTLKN